jgi:predicted  nucleic acid-binding Zn-ribbon protein
MSEEDIKRYIGIVTEEFKRYLHLEIEGLTGKMESMEDRLTKRIYSVEKRVGSLEKGVDSLEKKVGSLEKRFDSLDTSVKELKEELIAHRDNTEMHAQRAKRKSRAS